MSLEHRNAYTQALVALLNHSVTEEINSPDMRRMALRARNEPSWENLMVTATLADVIIKDCERKIDLLRDLAAKARRAAEAKA